MRREIFQDQNVLKSSMRDAIRCDPAYGDPGYFTDVKLSIHFSTRCIQDLAWLLAVEIEHA